MEQKKEVMINFKPVFLDNVNDRPFFATSGASGMDVKADIADELVIGPGERKLVSTGIFMSLADESVECQVRPRSGLALKKGLTVLNSPGTIDCVPAGTLINIDENTTTPVEELYRSNERKIYSYNESEKLPEHDLIKAMWIVEDSELIEFSFEDGTILKVPPTKEVYTKSGWKIASEVKEDEEILSL